MKFNKDTALAYLLDSTAHLTGGTKELCDAVLNYPAFLISPGGSDHHHNYRHGLVIHVAEVMRNVRCMGEPDAVLLTAVLWHDYMKTRDYELVGETVVKTEYRKRVGHVAGSFAAFYMHAAELHAEIGFVDEVSHCLLSHHGRKEWGSPVEPMTANAFILHAADMMSSRGIIL